MNVRVRIKLEEPLRRRLCTRKLPYAWPFLLSVDPDSGEIVRNLPPDPAPKRVRTTKRVKESTKVARVLIKTPL